MVLVLPYINMNLPQVYMCSPSCTPLQPHSPYHPCGSTRCTRPKHTVSCIEPEVVIRFIYDIIHVSMPFSQITPPSPTESLLFNMLSRLVITLLPRSKLTLISWLQSPSAVILASISSPTSHQVIADNHHDP